MSTEDAKTYLSKREIPRLFESLMTGLMYHRPTDHIAYLIDCLAKVSDKDNGKRPKSRSKTPAKIESPVPLEEKRGTPLPPIADPADSAKINDKVTSDTKAKTVKKADIPDVPIVFIMGGPGSGKLTQVTSLLKLAEGWVHLSMGDILRNEIAQKGKAEDKWSMIGDLVSKGEMAPEEVTGELLLDSFKQHKNAKGFILEGYPRDMEQVEEYMKVIGKVTAVFYLDCEEYYCTQRLLNRGKKTDRIDDNLGAISKRITFFKDNTLPVVKYYDDMGRVFVVNGDRDTKEIAFEMGNLFKFLKKNNFELKNAKPLTAPPPQKKQERRPSTPKQKDSKDNKDSTVKPEDVIVPLATRPPTIDVPDTGRKDGLPTCPIILIVGGPGSGKGTQCKKVCERYKEVIHLSMGDILRNQIATQGSADEKWGMIGTLVQKGEMAPQEVTAELLIEQIKKNKDAAAFIVEGYPRDKLQLEEFNKHIGGLNFAILLDCEEYYMQKRLLDRGNASGRIDDNLNAIQSRLTFFKNNTLPILKHLDDQGKLVAIDGDRDLDEIFFNISQVLDFAFFGRKPQPPGAGKCNYVITDVEAEKRGKYYDAVGRTYLFDLDYNDGDCPYTVDAGYYGNVSHFINHSCDPNLEVFGVWINTLDPTLPRIALFSRRDIEKGEELTFDYMMTGDTTNQPPTLDQVEKDLAAEFLKTPVLQTYPDMPEGEGDSLEVTLEENDTLPELKPDEVKETGDAADSNDSNDSNIPELSIESDEVFDEPPKLETQKSELIPKSLTDQYRIVCQCGAKNCRKYLF
ncbi:AK [Mytilus edulis]|uniref:Adk n=1 Tax=Mytilus edulis TaxID=6550 RepID=A0A8S3S1H7_MYTED|nr:AK [Mytilus edulis]